MGYIKTTNNEVVVDAILTPAGRAELSQGKQLNITRFVLSDDQINYGLYNIQNPGGSDYFDIAIRNLPILEPSMGVESPFKYNLYTDTDGIINIASLYLAGSTVQGSAIQVSTFSTPVQVSALLRNAPAISDYFFYAVLENNYLSGNTKQLSLVNNDPAVGGTTSKYGVSSQNTDNVSTNTTGVETNTFSDYDSFIQNVVIPFNSNTINKNKTMIAFKNGFSLIRNSSLTSSFTTSVTVYPSAVISHIAPVTYTVTSELIM